MRSDLPSGNVTFLFSDMEGSTRLLQQQGDRFAELLAEHRRTMRAAFGRHGGVEVGTEGDSFFVAFASSGAAVSAAVEAQRAHEGGPIRVRMGLHTGEAQLTDEGYVGLNVHMAARIAAAAHGGQVVLSHQTRVHVDDTVPLVDLGEHRLKDFDEPVRLCQVGEQGFPPLRTISNTNLPRPASSFVGRQQEVGEITSTVGEGSRLITLTGSGGCGKSRLAIEVAAGLLSEFGAGVFWVGLAPLRDLRLVTETIAQTLGAKVELASHIGERQLLLLLDNFEQVIEAAPELSALLKACPNLCVIVTSRELLRVQGEVEYPVLPLADAEAVELFCGRARVEPDESIRDLCRALDRLPLALELAAGRSSILTPAQILARLPQRLDLFRGGRDTDPRQQTLRSTIEWSHELLPPQEQQLFARLSVFAGGCTLEAAEEVAEGDLDTLQALVEKSLLRHSGERFWMLETIREYALERLDEHGAAAQLRRRHAEHFLALAEGAEPELAGDREAEWLELLEQDYANLRASLAWSLDAGAADLGLRLAGALTGFWYMRGYLGEGRRWLADMLAVADDRSPARANALFGAALLASLQGDWPEAKRWSQSCRDLSLDLGEWSVAAESLNTLGRATLAEGDPEQARLLFEEAAKLAGANDAPRIEAISRFNLGYESLSSGDYPRAREEFEASREGMAALGHRYGIARSLAALGSVALHDGRVGDAVAHLRRSLELARTLGDTDNAAWALELMGVAFAESQSERGARLLGAAETLRKTLGVSLEGVELGLHDRALAALRATLTAEALTAAWTAGAELPVERAVEQALHDS